MFKCPKIFNFKYIRLIFETQLSYIINCIYLPGMVCEGCKYGAYLAVGVSVSFCTFGFHHNKCSNILVSHGYQEFPII